jgi:hypothetical protein
MPPPPTVGPDFRSLTLVWLHCTDETRVVHDQFYRSCKRRAASGATALDCGFRFAGIAGEIADRRGPFRSGDPLVLRALK